LDFSSYESKLSNFENEEIDVFGYNHKTIVTMEDIFNAIPLKEVDITRLILVFVSNIFRLNEGFSVSNRLDMSVFLMDYYKLFEDNYPVEKLQVELTPIYKQNYIKHSSPVIIELTQHMGSYKVKLDVKQYRRCA